MTSNLGSDEIAEHGLQLRDEAAALTEQRYGEQHEQQDVQVTETVTISRRCAAQRVQIPPVSLSRYREFLHAVYNSFQMKM